MRIITGGQAINVVNKRYARSYESANPNVYQLNSGSDDDTALTPAQLARLKAEWQAADKAKDEAKKAKIKKILKGVGIVAGTAALAGAGYGLYKYGQNVGSKSRQGEIDNLNNDNTRLRGENSSLRSQVYDQSQQIKNLSDSVNTLSNSNAAYRQKVDQLTEEKRKLDELSTSVTQTYNNLQKEYEELKNSDVGKLASSNAEYAQQLENKEAELAAAEENIKKLNETKGKLETELQTAQNNIKTANEERDAANAERDAANNRAETAANDALNRAAKGSAAVSAANKTFWGNDKSNAAINEYNKLIKFEAIVNSAIQSNLNIVDVRGCIPNVIAPDLGNNRSKAVPTDVAKKALDMHADDIRYAYKASQQQSAESATTLVFDNGVRIVF